MELDKILHFVPSHIEQIIVVLLVLFGVTTILLLIRSLKEKPEGRSSDLDVGSIEGALKRVLAQNPPAVVERPAAVGTTDGAAAPLADLAPLKAALAEKEKQLASLTTELTEVKAVAATATAAAGNAGAASAGEAPTAAALEALEGEISELKARLAEYEIIEDDIADLALYKEENARLKREIEQARVSGGDLPLPSPAPEPIEAPVLEHNPAAGIPGLAEALQEEAAAPAPAPAAEEPISEGDLLATLPEAPVDALGSLDTDKMLSEAENLSLTPPADDAEINALSDLLDTDKLLEEVSSLDAQDVMSEFKDKSKIG